MSYGYSSETQRKQRIFRNFLKWHMNYLRPYDGTDYIFIDLTAGPGKYVGMYGSPLIFLDEATTNGISFRAYLFDYDWAWTLQNNIKRFLEVESLPNNIIVHGYNSNSLTSTSLFERIFEELGDNNKGLIYSDANGLPLHFLLQELSKRKKLQDVDILTHFSASIIKRCRGRGYSRPLVNLLSPIERTQWVISEPRGKWQWTFLFCSNTSLAGEFNNLYKIGFAPTISPMGLYRLSKANDYADYLTMNEELALQLQA